MGLNETYYIIVNEKEKTFNVFDENNLEHIPKGSRSIAKITGDENCNEVMKLLWLLVPDYEEVKPFC